MADLSMMAESDGAPSGQFGSDSVAAPVVANATLLDLSVLLGFLRRSVPLLEPDGLLLDNFRELLAKEFSLEMLRRFISDPQCKRVIIQRQLVKGMYAFVCLPRIFIDILCLFVDEEEESEQSQQLNSTDLDCVQYTISEEFNFNNPKISSLMLTKKGQILEAEKPLLQQVRFENVNAYTPIEEMHHCVSTFLAPFFKDNVKATGRAERYVIVAIFFFVFK